MHDRTSADRRAATRWVWPMLGQCAIPREAAQLLRTTACKLPSQLHTSLVRSYLLSFNLVCVCVFRISEKNVGIYIVSSNTTEKLCYV